MCGAASPAKTLCLAPPGRCLLAVAIPYLPLARSHGPLSLLSCKSLPCWERHSHLSPPDLSWANLGSSLGCEAKSGPVILLPVTGAGSWWGWGVKGGSGELHLFQSDAHGIQHTGHCRVIVWAFWTTIAWQWGSQRWISFKHLGPAVTLKALWPGSLGHGSEGRELSVAVSDAADHLAADPHAPQHPPVHPAQA